MQMRAFINLKSATLKLQTLPEENQPLAPGHPFKAPACLEAESTICYDSVICVLKKVQSFNAVTVF